MKNNNNTNTGNKKNKKAYTKPTIRIIPFDELIKDGEGCRKGFC